METEVLIMTIVTGFLLPFVTTFLTKAVWPEWSKFLIVLVLATIVGAVELVASGQVESISGLTFQDLYAYIGPLYLASGATFWLLIDTTGLRPWLEAHGVK